MWPIFTGDGDGDWHWHQEDWTIDSLQKLFHFLFLLLLCSATKVYKNSAAFHPHMATQVFFFMCYETILQTFHTCYKKKTQKPNMYIFMLLKRQHFVGIAPVIPELFFCYFYFL